MYFVNVGAGFEPARRGGQVKNLTLRQSGIVYFRGNDNTNILHFFPGVLTGITKHHILSNGYLILMCQVEGVQ